MSKQNSEQAEIIGLLICNCFGHSDFVYQALHFETTIFMSIILSHTSAWVNCLFCLEWGMIF